MIGLRNSRPVSIVQFLDLSIHLCYRHLSHVPLLRITLGTERAKRKESVSEIHDQSAFFILWTSLFIYLRCREPARDKRTQNRMIGRGNSRPVNIQMFWTSLFIHDAETPLETRGPKTEWSVSEIHDQSACGVLWTSFFIYVIDIYNACCY